MTARMAMTKISKVGKPKRSYLETMLENKIAAAGLPAPVQQFHAVPKRRFSWDFAYPDPEHRILIEVQGSIWKPNTGHNSGKGLRRDYTKNNLAVKAGYHCLYFDKRMIQSGEAVAILREMLEASNG